MRTVTTKNIKTDNETPVKFERLFYLYFVLMPLLSFVFMYFDDTVWHNYLNVIDFSVYPTIAMFYHFFCIIAFGYSGVVAFLLIQATPIPKNKLLTLLIVLSTPLTMLIDYFTGAEIHIADTVIFDFVFTMLAFTVAELILAFKPDKIFFAGSYAIMLALTYYGVHTFNILKHADTKSLVLYGLNFIVAVWAFYSVLSGKSNETTKIQKDMSKWAIGSGIVVMHFILIVYIITIFKAMQ